MDETQRHRAEVRSVLRWRETEGRDWVNRWLYGYTDDHGKPVKGVEQTRGKAAADRIAADAAEQWRRGSRGEWGRWEE